MMSYLAPNEHLLTVNAGRPTPLWWREQEQCWRLLTANLPEAVDGLMNLPLGVLPETGYQQFAVRLGVGDLVVLYSDSLIEAPLPGGEPLGLAGLLQLAGHVGPAKAERFNHRLFEQVREACEGVHDDMTLMTLHHHAQRPPGLSEQQEG